MLRYNGQFSRQNFFWIHHNVVRGIKTNIPSDFKNYQCSHCESLEEQADTEQDGLVGHIRATTRMTVEIIATLCRNGLHLGQHKKKEHHFHSSSVSIRRSNHKLMSPLIQPKLAPRCLCVPKRSIDMLLTSVLVSEYSKTAFP